jgi:hypothetical protein
MYVYHCVLIYCRRVTEVRSSCVGPSVLLGYYIPMPSFPYDFLLMLGSLFALRFYGGVGVHTNPNVCPHREVVDQQLRCGSTNACALLSSRYICAASPAILDSITIYKR